MRADAARNRSAILDAAHTVLAERGLDISLNEVAHRAGVGNATLYRHFPTREALIAEVFEQQMRRYVETAERAASASDPAAGFREFVTVTCALQAGHRALADLLVTRRPFTAEVDALRDRQYAAVVTAVRRAVTAGAVRSDLSPSDIAVLLMANAGVIARAGNDAGAASARMVALWLAGVSVRDATAPAPVTEAAISRALERPSE